MTEIEPGRVTGRGGAEVLGLSLRQVRRTVAAHRKEGAAGLAHGNRGRTSSRKTPAAMHSEILDLARNRYSDHNDTLFTEKLEKLHDIEVSRSTVRRSRRSIAQGSPSKRRPPRHRTHRERHPLEGMLLQLDGSPHQWLEGRGHGRALVPPVPGAGTHRAHDHQCTQQHDEHQWHQGSASGRSPEHRARPSPASRAKERPPPSAIRVRVVPQPPEHRLSLLLVNLLPCEPASVPRRSTALRGDGHLVSSSVTSYHECNTVS